LSLNTPLDLAANHPSGLKAIKIIVSAIDSLAKSLPILDQVAPIMETFEAPTTN
jgi:hypothetical protein